jgi:hypothetical protein
LVTVAGLGWVFDVDHSFDKDFLSCLGPNRIEKENSAQAKANQKG